MGRAKTKSALDIAGSIRLLEDISRNADSRQT
jgi:hypothetical protein